MKYRHFTLSKLNNKELELGRVKISSKSGTPLDAAKKLLKTVCSYEGLTKNKKLKCKAIFYIRETTERCNKIYGPYKGTYKKYNKPVIVTLKDGRQIKHFYYPDVVKIKESKSKKIIQKGGEPIVYNYNNDNDNCIKLDNGGNKQPVFCYNKDGTKIASNSYNNRIDIFDTKTGCNPLSFDVNVYRISSICYRPGSSFIAICGVINNISSTIGIWNCDTGDHYLTIKKDDSSSSLHSMCYSPDGKKICAAARNYFCIWDSNTGDELLTIKIEKYLKELPFKNISLKSISFSPDGRKIAASIIFEIPTSINNNYTADNSMIRIFNSSNGNVLLNIDIGNDDSIMSMCFSPNGEKIATSSMDGKICIWKSYTRKNPLLTFFGVPIKKTPLKKTPLLTFHTDFGISSLHYSPDGSQIAGRGKKEVSIWDPSSGSLLFVINFNQSFFDVIPNSLCYNPYGKKIAIGYFGNKNSMYNRQDKVRVGFINIIDLMPNNNINNTINIFSLNISKQCLIKFKFRNLYKETFTDYEFLYDKTKDLDLENFDLCKFYTNLLIISFKNNYDIFDENNIGTFINNVVEFIYSLKKSKNNKKNTNEKREKKLLRFYSKFLYEYLKILYNRYNPDLVFSNSHFKREVLDVQRGNELDMILRDPFNGKYKKKIKVRYINKNGVAEIGLNYSGLSKNYFDDLGKELNSRIEKLRIEKLRIEKLRIENAPQIDVITILKILRFSKINQLPIYLIDTTLKNTVLEKIISGIKKDHSKAILEKLLLYEGEYFGINDLRLSMLNDNNNNNEKDYAEINYAEINYEKIKSNTINKIKILNKNKDVNYRNNQSNNPIMVEIDDYIREGYYKNYLDFYLSHFIKFTLNVEDIIERIKYDPPTEFEEEFKKEFNKLLRSLSEEELTLFNKAMTGISTLRDVYKIHLYNYSNSLLFPVFHTCSNTMDIQYNNQFKERFFNNVNGKENFVEAVKLSLESFGFA